MNALRTDFLQLANEIALQAGQIQTERRHDPFRIERKPDKTLVSEIDILINELTIETILRYHPGHAIVGEEVSHGDPDSEHVWYVDPLDGTGEYIEGGHKEPTFGYGIAKTHKGRLDVGLFHNPTRQQTFYATRDNGSYLNSERINVNQDAFKPGTKYDYSHWEGAPYDPTAFETMLGAPIGHYSAIYQACMVASGRSAFSVFPGSTIHDIAPGAIITLEAGGRTTDLQGIPHDWNGPISGAVYSNPFVHQPVIDALRSST